jgi:hypothetical protein
MVKIGGILSIALLTFVVCGCSKKPSAKEPGHSAPQSAHAQRTEQNWLAGTVVTDLVRLAAFAGGKLPPDPSSINVETLPDKEGKTAYRVSLPDHDGTRGRVVDLVISTNVLDAKTYEPLGAALREMYALKPDAAKVESRSADILTAFTVETFLAENSRVSAFLTAHPASVEANEDAAVLLGAFAMRENSGWFWNPLPACARAVAHLALADALGAKTADSADGLLADLFVGLIVDTKAKCQSQIDELGAYAMKRPALVPWVNAARFRNTRDWRALPVPVGIALVEKVEKFRALCDAGSTALGSEFLSKAQPENVPDWARIVMETRWTVGDGHRFTDGMLAGELAEAGKVLKRPIPKNSVEAASFVKALNMPQTPAVGVDAEGKPAISVIDPAMWAQTAQRHICHAIYETWYFLAEMWGVPEEAQNFWSSMDRAFSHLELFPVVALMRNSAASDTKPYAASLEALFETHPELVPDIAWYRAGASRYSSLFPDVRNRAAAWFSPPILPGTAYRYSTRYKQLTNFQHPTLAQIEPIYRIAPLQAVVVTSYLDTKFSGGINGNELKEIAGPLLDYCLPVIEFAADHVVKDAALREELLLAGAKVNPDSADVLAEFYRRQNQMAKAAEAYQLYVDKAADRVRVSNTCQWLVDYYFENGRKDKAVEVAKMAAEVYSYSGLETYAGLLDRMGDLTGAEENYERIAERYDSNAPLYLFYKRHESQMGEIGGKAKAMEAEVFPGGMRAASLRDFSGKPKTGVSINGESDLLRKNGLKAGDVIVSIEGWRVDTFDQYSFIRELSESPRFRLIVYQDGQYREIAAEAEGRRFGVDMATLR